MGTRSVSTYFISIFAFLMLLDFMGMFIRYTEISLDVFFPEKGT
jgi:hypothetical protein